MRSSIGFVVGALCCLLGACTTAPAPQASAAQSIFYVAERGSAKVYIFGTCGAGDGSWLTPQLKRALVESGEFWREIPTAPLDAASVTFGNKLGQRASGSLFDDLSPTERQRVTNAAATLSIDRASLEPMKPWYAARVLALRSAAQAGRGVATKPGEKGDQGNPELVLSDLAAKQGKPIKSEYANWNDFTLSFDRMSLAAQREYVSYSLDGMEHGADQVRAAEVACASADLSYFEKNVRDFSAEYPELYEALNGARDAEWAYRIDQFLTTGGTYFILVGVNHMLGPGSIQAALTKAGVSVRRADS